jgi:hypothetical protein
MLSTFESEMLALEFQRTFFAVAGNRATLLLPDSCPSIEDVEEGGGGGGGGETKSNILTEHSTMQEWNNNVLANVDTTRISYSDIAHLIGSESLQCDEPIMDQLKRDLKIKAKQINKDESLRYQYACLHRHYFLKLLIKLSDDPSSLQLLGRYYEDCYDQMNTPEDQHRAFHCYTKSWEVEQAEESKYFSSEILEFVRLPTLNLASNHILISSRGKNELIAGVWEHEMFLLVPSDVDEKQKKLFEKKLEEAKRIAEGALSIISIGHGRHNEDGDEYAMMDIPSQMIRSTLCLKNMIFSKSKYQGVSFRKRANKIFISIGFSLFSSFVLISMHL